MKIISNELYKLITSKAFIFTFVAAVLLVLYSSAVYQTDTVDSAQYKMFFSDISDAEDKTEYIENLLADELKSDEVSLEWRNKITFYRDQLEQAQTIENYSTYLEDIGRNAETMTSVSIFADKGSYTYRNAVLTPKAYEAVREVVPVFSPSEGLLLALENKVTDIVFIFVLVSAVMVLIGKEREVCIISLIKPLKKGRCTLCCAKISVLFITAVLTYAVLLVGTLVIGEAKFGLGELSRPVQSIEGFIGCNLPISVFQLLLMVFVIKVLTAFAVTIIFQCLCTKFSVTASLVSLAVAAAAEIVMYALIDFTSAAAPLAAINLAAFTDSANLFSAYSCINVFGYPINYLTAAIVSLGVVIAAAIFTAVYMFGKISISASGKFRMPSLFSRFIPRTPFSYSLYKVLIMHKGILIIMIALAVHLYSAVTYNVAYDVDDVFYKSYCDTLSEMDNNEAEEFISVEEDRFNTLLSSLSSPELKTSDVVQIGRELSAKTGFEQAKIQYEYITRLSSENKAMFYLSGWNELFGVNGYKSDMQLALIVISALCLVILPCVSCDKKFRLGFLINSTRLGKGTYYKHNFIIAALIAAALSCVVNLSHFCAVLSAYGSDGIHYSIRCLSLYEGCADIPIWGYLLILLVTRVIISALFSCLLVWISSIANGISNAILLGFVIFVLPVLIYLAGYDFVLCLCVPLSVNNLWLNVGFAVGVNLTIFIGGGVASLIYRLCRK